MQAKNDFVSHNNTVKDVCKEIGLGNPFDATKLDSKTKLPEILLENDYAVIHIGDDKHKFIKGISDVFHDFEPVRETLIREYTKSVLNQYNSSESNILSVANNRRIVHHFLFDKKPNLKIQTLSNVPKPIFHTAQRLLLNIIWGKRMQLQNIRIEIDLTIEFEGTVGVFEGKNGRPEGFSIYQIYHP